MARPYNRHNAEKVLRAIVTHKQAHDGASPTSRELCDACEISSPSVVHRLLRHLADEGYIRIAGGKNRSIEVAGGQWTHVDPTARFPRPDAPGRCDICGRKATWDDGDCAYCRIHEPLY